jgi:hypothetical protein
MSLNRETRKYPSSERTFRWSKRYLDRSDSKHREQKPVRYFIKPESGRSKRRSAQKNPTESVPVGQGKWPFEYNRMLIRADDTRYTGRCPDCTLGDHAAGCSPLIAVGVMWCRRGARIWTAAGGASRREAGELREPRMAVTQAMQERIAAFARELATELGEVDDRDRDAIEVEQIRYCWPLFRAARQPLFEEQIDVTASRRWHRGTSGLSPRV